MRSNPWKGILPDFAVRQVRARARKLVGHYGFGRSDVEDIEDDLAIEVCHRLPNYDEAKGTLKDFTCSLVRKAAATMVEYRMAAKRGGGRCIRSLDSPIRGADGSLTYESELLEGSDADRRRGVERSHFITASDLEMEVKAFLKKGLRADILDLCLRLLDGDNLTDISKDTGIPRATLYGRRGKLRQLMEKAGLQKFHSSSGASDVPSVDH